MAEESGQRAQKKSLLQKYDIPIEFLEFSYIETCNDVKLLEKIVKVLRSGEEGFYPDLTKCAEEKLKALKPDSKMFRVEEAALTKESMDDEKREKIDKEMKLWLDEMKTQDQLVRDIKPTMKPEPPIRKTNGTKVMSTSSDTKTTSNLTSKDVERIRSTDYAKWDQFDADAAELKIDLDEEREREMVEVKNKKNLQKPKLIEEIQDEVGFLTDFEKDRLALKFKEKGNECFKAKDYDEAVAEYSQSLKIKRTPAAFNNRALVYLKLKHYIKVINDTNECLKMEPKNIKALIRKGQAFVGQEMYSEAVETFEKVVDVDSSNQFAQNELFELRKKLPTTNAFRMKIEEIDETTTSPLPAKKTVKSEKLELSDTIHVPKMVQNIVIEESTPFDKLMPKEKQPREKLIMPIAASTKKASLIQEIL